MFNYIRFHIDLAWFSLKLAISQRDAEAGISFFVYHHDEYTHPNC